MRRVVAGATALAVLVAAGCVSVNPASGLRAGSGVGGVAVPAVTARAQSPEAPADQTALAQAAEGRWPARWGASGSPRGAVVTLETAVGDLRQAHLGRFHQLRTGPAEYDQAQRLAKAVGIEDGFRFETEGPGSLVYLPPIEAPAAPVGDADGADLPASDGPDDAVGVEVFVFVSGRETDESTPDDPRIAIERTWMALYDANGAGEEPAGTIVLIPGMLGTPQPIIEGMINFWRNSGFTVLRMMAHPSRFTERVEVAVGDGAEAQAGATLARIYDERTAETAYAVDAGLTHALSLRPGLADRPVVLVGMSGGAMVLPSVYAYAPQRYDAAVLIAGGVNFLRISALSNYAEWIDAVVLDWDAEDPASPGRATPERLERLSSAYLASSKLDSTHTAAAMADIPVLMLHSTRDRAVPSDLGEAMWRLLGTPERWVFPVGHEMIFLMLPTQAERLTAWIRGAIAPPAGAGVGGITGDEASNAGRTGP